MRGKILIVVIAAVALFAGGAPAPAPARGGAEIVRTDAGLLRGTVHDGYRTFEGVPYAAPPTGERRWRAPQPVARWRGVRSAEAPGAACKQNGLGFGQPTSGDEDCLYVGVTTPLDGRGHHPVLVFLPGGGFQTGSGSLYDPHRLAVQGGVVVVTVNYRLGVFGYLGLPGLAGSGTFGLQDQQAALRWVRRNAAAFGGDPGTVTLAGQSAGGMSVCAQLTSPATAGLFQRAIIQSGSCLTDWPAELFLPNVAAGSQWASVAEVRREGTRLAERLGCRGDAPACLRSQPAETLLRETEGTGLKAFVDPAYGTPVLPRKPADALRAGAFHRVPVLSGGNLDEHRAFVAALDLAGPVTAERYTAVLRAAFGGDADRVLAEYPVAAYPSPGLAWAAVATDRIWACPTLAGNRLLARHNPTYAYEFAERDGPNPGLGYPWGAYHGAELPYLFDVTYLPDTAPPALAGEMVGAWALFAATGRAGWPRFGAGAAIPYTRILATGASGGADVAAEHHCGLWSRISAPERSSTS
ncbi:carboxylic ester hydrolase [Paractinoplanes deccanensis]|uniref:Carboxylic ester hydrolase n=1 Tax=Paractinoplanes deccanensis TaxID=113561 RepID=A0ABQ3Y2Q3_9ACTN|nr:carboxylesterase family protein [Actinoplanes deccanensis]GID74274.1 carboxylic ester hydrolase [Actinoplanes deccanensis]